MGNIDPDTALKLLGGVVAMLVAIIALTPTKRDDEALRGFLGQLSPVARKTIGGGAVATAVALAVSLLGGCGGSGLEVARGTAAGGALAVVAADPMLADAYDDARVAFEAGSLSESAYDARLERLDRAERALRSLSSALSAVDLALGAAEDGQACGLRPALDGAVDAAQDVLDAFDAAGLDMPPLVGQVLGIGGVLVDAPECTAGAS